MGDRIDRRAAALAGILLAVMAFTNDVVLSPPEFVEDRVASVVDLVNDRPADGSSGGADVDDQQP